MRNSHEEKHGNLDDFKFDIKTFKMPTMESLELLPLDELEKKVEEEKEESAEEQPED